ncbi:hypothetical protein BD413DRAFT_485329 [Trametes elegans]|nr:hypothetical protein BD413DRAFT_485329 [Trametes elegans]
MRQVEGSGEVAVYGPVRSEHAQSVSTQYDPVCPLADARAVERRFDGAALPVQNSYGHCTTSAPSLTW